ncbi:hypothetical protein FFWV33_04400 [Flavobacterium faecale]|uniref:Uncharacterized protein n=1 Tax=Flavobacterium faecale TaxID=1355330 RepID=A0A2S1LB97_9FLAO|nr:hypothetical protein [Flavobacterium faecale]AWG20836.1 hypothetical protein FFWV33_04400 [Flavobacterium faecale]
MDLFKVKDEILAAFGNMRAMERLHIDTNTEEKIKNISGTKIAESTEGQFWVSFQELNGFLLLNAIILGHSDLKTFDGIKLLLLTAEYEIEIESDDKEIVSNFSNISSTWITKVSFIIDHKKREIIENGNVDAVEYYFKNKVTKLYKI